MSIWFAVPSKRPPSEANPVLAKWRNQGYKVAAWLDFDDWLASSVAPLQTDFTLSGSKYPGYAVAVNTLCKEIIRMDSEAEWIVTGGDDVHPDPNHSAREIGRDCTAYFGGRECVSSSGGTFGVMQPTGDRWGEDPNLPNLHPMRTAYIDRVCGSPWMGRAFCERMYGGNGPFYDGYFHMFPDEELQEVATRLGVFWQRRDLVHLHNHWARQCENQMPSFLARANSRQHWAEAQNLFVSRKAEGFPGHQPLALAS